MFHKWHFKGGITLFRAYHLRGKAPQAVQGKFLKAKIYGFGLQYTQTGFCFKLSDTPQ